MGAVKQPLIGALFLLLFDSRLLMPAVLIVVSCIKVQLCRQMYPGAVESPPKRDDHAPGSHRLVLRAPEITGCLSFSWYQPSAKFILDPSP